MTRMLHGALTIGGRTARWWFTARDGGVSTAPYASWNVAAHVGDVPAAVRENRRLLEVETGGIPVSWPGPTHGTEIAVLTEPVALTPNVDVLMTEHDRVPLATLAADCVPMLVVTPRVVVAAHVGWRGLADGITAAIVDRLAAAGADVVGAEVLLGPAICGACYGVPAERAQTVAGVCPEAVGVASNGDPGIDVRVGLAAQWRSHGVHVTQVGPCTAESDAYFSHRRDGVTGRQAGVVVWQ